MVNVSPFDDVSLWRMLLNIPSVGLYDFLYTAIQFTIASASKRLCIKYLNISPRDLIDTEWRDKKQTNN